MASRVTGVDGVMAALKRVGDAVCPASAAALQGQGEVIAARSREYAPVDTGDLERDHKVETGERGSLIVTVVSVGGDGGPADDHVLPMHEGTYNLGPGSAQKAALSGKVVGRKFLERAFNEQAPKITAAVNESVRKALEP